ncbi:hypothetical protein Hanom_Chr16g01425771 [Helianthus anomalus]
MADLLFGFNDEVRALSNLDLDCNERPLVENPSSTSALATAAAASGTKSQVEEGAKRPCVEETTKPNHTGNPRLFNLLRYIYGTSTTFLNFFKVEVTLYICGFGNLKEFLSLEMFKKSFFISSQKCEFFFEEKIKENL